MNSHPDPAVGPVGAQPIDVRVLEQLIHDLGAPSDYIINRFAQEMQTQQQVLQTLQALETPVDTGSHVQLDALRRAAHRLKSSSLTIGAERLGQMARTVELALAPDSPGPRAVPGSLLDEIHHELQTVLEVLQRYAVRS
jgi:HPt (histidine-containing phosphotransfer) domain-containing protein